jgi:hypothetical protein
MAFLGDFGKIFLGGATTADVGGAVGGLFGQEKVGRQIGGTAAQVVGGLGGTQQGQSVAISQATQTRPQETQASGTMEKANVIPQQGTYFPSQPAMQAGFGLATPLVSAGRKFLPDILGGLLGGAVIGGAAPLVLDAFGEPKKMRVTRKMQRTVKQVVDQFGLEGAMQLTGLDQQTIMFIYTRKFRNDGPYVTKAAVRKTRQTVRKMKSLCDMYDDLRPAAKRRAPVRRTGMTKITQVK